MKITQKDIDDLVTSYKTFGEYETKLSNRINEVLTIIAKAFKTKKEWWDWNNGGGEVDGHFEPDMIADDVVEIDVGFSKSRDMVAILRGEEWELRSAFPKWFLFEDFEQELINGIAEFKKEEEKCLEEDARKREKNKVLKKKLVDSAKSKLSKEEKKALGI